jgi:MFS family permease
MVTLFSYLVAIAVALLMDKFRRRTFFLGGCGGILVVLIAWTIASEQFTEHGSVVGGRIVIACIFLYQGLYSVAWLNLVVAYPLELVPYHMRAKTWSYVLLVIYIAQIFGNYVNPIGLDSIGWKFYIYLDVWTALCLVIVYFFFIETQGPTLEELALSFDDIPEGTPKALKNFDDIGVVYEAENEKADHTVAKV